jgi:DNA-binding NtrC family response regulator
MEKSILVVDDNNAISAVVSEFLSNLGLAATTVDNGAKAIEFLESHHVDAVICDINMPVMSGIECLIKCRVRNLAPPFIFMTGMEDSRYLFKAVRLGAADFLMKPIEEKELALVVARVLELSNSEQQLWSIIDKVLAREDLAREKDLVQNLRFRIGSIRVLHDRNKAN